MTSLKTSQFHQISQTLRFGRALLPEGWANDVEFDIHDGEICAIRTDCGALPTSRSALVALPGMPNLHSHAFQRAMSGRTEFRQSSETDSFWTWREQLYRFVDQATPQDIEAISALAFAEMLEGGFTRVCEFHYLHNDKEGRPYSDPGEIAGRVVQAASDAGIGLTMLPVFYARGGFGGQPPADGQRRFLSTPDSFAALLDRTLQECARLPDAVLGVAPHSLRAVTPEELALVSEMRPGKPVHIHIAEQTKEVDDSIGWSGLRPVEWLLEHADIGKHWCLVHSTHTTAAERKRMARCGAVAGLCPVTEANLGDGIFELDDFLQEGGQFGVGSDSNVSIDAADELRLLEYSQRLRFQQRNIVSAGSKKSTGRTLFDLALAGGNQAAGSASALAIGHPADLLVLDNGETATASGEPDRILDEWVFRSGKMSISEVWRRGSRIVESGRHIRRAEFEAGFKSALERILY